jgi:hypothetical protein
MIYSLAAILFQRGHMHLCTDDKALCGTRRAAAIALGDKEHAAINAQTRTPSRGKAGQSKAASM